MESGDVDIENLHQPDFVAAYGRIDAHDELGGLVISSDGDGLACDEIRRLDRIAARPGAGGVWLAGSALRDMSRINDKSKIHEEIEVWIVVEVRKEGVLINAKDSAHDVVGSKREALIEPADCGANNVIGKRSTHVGVDP